MKLYRAKIPVIAHEVIKTLDEEGDIEVLPEKRDEAEKDLVAIMEEYQRRDYELRKRTKDHMHSRKLPYDAYGRVRGALADEINHPTGGDVERYLTRQFMENMMITPNIDEVWSSDKDLRRKILTILRSHDVDEREIREEAKKQIKNVDEGTVDYEIALQKAIREVRKRRGLIT